MTTFDAKLMADIGTSSMAGGSSIVDRFTEILVAEKGYSHHTCLAYRSDVMDFMHFYVGSHDGEDSPADLQERFMAQVDEVGRNTLKRYLAAQVQAGKKKKTLARRISALKAFFKFLLRDGQVADNPVDGIPFPKLGPPIPLVLTVDDVYLLLDSIKTDTWMGKRNRAMFETFYSTGMRISEIRGLDMEHIDFHTQVIRVLGKGGRERMVPVGDRALTAVEVYREALSEDLAPVFVNKDLGRLSTRSIRRILDQIVNQCGLHVPVSPHVLRHCFASHMLDAGADMQIIKEILGHASLSTTQLYTHVSMDHLVKVYDCAHPRSR